MVIGDRGRPSVGLRSALPAHGHPSFADGNGRTARLLMNLLLLRQGYPPIAVHPEDRIAYLYALERGSRDDLTPFQNLMHERLDGTLAAYLDLLQKELPSS